MRNGKSVRGDNGKLKSLVFDNLDARQQRYLALHVPIGAGKAQMMRFLKEFLEIFPEIGLEPNSAEMLRLAKCAAERKMNVMKKPLVKGTKHRSPLRPIFKQVVF